MFTYSPWARNATRRGIMAEIMMESKKDRWLEATITGPVAGEVFESGHAGAEDGASGFR